MYVLQRDASRSPSRENGSTELLPGSHTPHLRSSYPSGSTCASLVHTHFMYRLTECVLGSLLRCFMLFWLMKGFLGKLCFQDTGESWSQPWRCNLPFQSSTPLSQVTMLFLATLWIIPPFTPVFVALSLTSMPLCSVEKKDTVLIACPSAPSSSDHLVSTHFLLISGTPLYINEALDTN